MNAKKQEIVNRLAEMERENRRLQALLTDAVSLTEYRPLAEGDDWTRALSAALREHEIVRIPAGEYLLSGGVVIPSNRRIEADERAVLRLKPNARLLLLRNERTQDGTRYPVRKGARDRNIAIVGGRWEESSDRRRGLLTAMTSSMASHFFVDLTIQFLLLWGETGSLDRFIISSPYRKWKPKFC